MTRPGPSARPGPGASVAFSVLLLASCSGSTPSPEQSSAASATRSVGPSAPSSSDSTATDGASSPSPSAGIGGGLVAFIRQTGDAVPGEIVIRDLATQRETSLATAGSPIAFSLDDSMLFVAEPINEYRDRLMAYPVGGGEPTELIDVFTTYAGASVSPDGRYVAFGSDGSAPNGLVVLDLLTGSASQLTTDGAKGTPRWSADSRLVAYEAFEPATAFNDLYVVDVGGGTPRRLTNDEFSDAPLGWSADGMSVVVSSDRDTNRNKGSMQTWLVNAITGAAIAAPGLEDEIARGSRSPEGSWEVFLRSDTLELRPTGGTSVERIVITRPADSSMQLTWSRDGAWLIWPQDDGGQSDLFVMRVPDGAPIRLTRTGADELLPVWGPIFSPGI